MRRLDGMFAGTFSGALESAFAVAAGAVALSGCLAVHIEVHPDPVCSSCANSAAKAAPAPAPTRAPAEPKAGPRAKPQLPALLMLESIPQNPRLVGRKNELAMFEVDGDALVSVWFRSREVAERALGLWRELVLRIPTNQRRDLVLVKIFEGGGRSGYVDNAGTGNPVGRYGYTLALNASNLKTNQVDPLAPLSRRRGNFDWTLIHEFAHMRSYADGGLNDFTRRFPGAKGSGEGYPEDGSPRTDGRWVTSYAERAGGDEDYAESFTTYVMLDQLPQGDSLAAQKVRWFDGRSGYPELRRRLRVTEADGSTSDLAAAPRVDYPFLVAPVAWMHGRWGGTTEDGESIEYTISSDDILRVRSRDGVELERIHYADLRADGQLATVDIYEVSDSFFLHQVSIAGSNFSESFRPEPGALSVANERLGDFLVHRLQE